MADKTILAAALQNENVQKMLDLLADTEGTDKLHGYNTLVGGKKITDLSSHPNQVGLTTGDGPSTAAGRYQITGTTWRGLQKKYGFEDFNQENQDLAAVALLREKGALKDLESGNFEKAIDKVKNVWVSLPGSSTQNQPKKSQNYVNKFLGIPSENSQSNDFQRSFDFSKITGGISTPAVEQSNSIYKAYFDGKLTPEQAADFEEDVNRGNFILPSGKSLKPASVSTPGKKVFQAPAELLAAYNGGQLTPEQVADFESDVDEGLIGVPTDFAKVKPPGLLDKAADLFTGDLRRTPETDSAADWAGMPELNSASLASLKAGLGTLLSGNDEIAAIIKANFPGVEVTKDDKGNNLLKSSIDGKTYAIKPGAQISDIPRAIAGAVGFTPAGRAGGVAGAALAGAGTQAVIEGSQAATGGDFDPANIAFAGAVGGVAPAIVSAVKSIRNGAGNALNTALPANPAVEIVANAPQLLPADKLNAAARATANGGIGSGRAKRILAEQAAPDQKTIAAARRLGVDAELQADQVTSNQSFRELAQAIKSTPGSEARAAELEGMAAVSDRADKIITGLGGSKDLSALDSNVKAEIAQIQQQLQKKSDDEYKFLAEKIPATSSAPAENVMSFINKRVEELGGRQYLSKEERVVADALGGASNTYARLDSIRKSLTAARVNRSGVFKDAESGLIKKLEAELKKDQAKVVDSFGLIDVFKSAQAGVRARKSLEDDMVGLFGREIQKSLLPELAAATKALPSGDATRFVNLLQKIPESQRSDVVAGGLQTAFGNSAKSGKLDFATYVNWYEGLLRNKQSRAAIMSHLPFGAKKQLSDLYRVSKGIAASSKERIATGRIQAVQEQIKGADSLIGNIYNVAQRSTAGLAAEAVTTPLGLPGSGIAAGVISALSRGKNATMKAADSFLASQEFNNLAKSIGTPSEKMQIKKIANSGRFVRFLKQLKNPPKMKDRVNFLTGLLQANNNLDEKNNEAN